MQASSIAPLTVSPEEFEFFRGLIFDLAGISMSPAKKDLIQTRLRARLAAHGLPDFAAYRAFLEKLEPCHPEWQEFVNRLTTNKTEWFREADHFHILTDHFLPRWLASGRDHLRVWCAASSTGEEPYSLAMTLSSALKETGRSFEIVATDIDTQVLAKAANGVYPRDRLVQIPPEYAETGFDRGRGEVANWIRVKKTLKSHVKFQTLNLTSGPYPWKDEFDVIFCRNVMIYFSTATIRDVAEWTHASAAKDAMLFIAHAESLQNVKSPWQYLRPSLYRKGGRY